MLRPAAILAIALGLATPALACTPEETAALRGFGCSEQQIAKRCTLPAKSPKRSIANLRQVRAPAQGVLSGGGNRLAPFRVTTPADGGYYFLKLTRPSDKRGAVMTIFMNAGATYETKVPLGSYVLRYASGTEWYGTQHLFGPCKTRFFEAQSVLVFERQGNQLSGHAVTLIKQAGGNLSTTPVDEDDF
jgi:hypothetical protein